MFRITTAHDPKEPYDGGCTQALSSPCFLGRSKQRKGDFCQRGRECWRGARKHRDNACECPRRRGRGGPTTESAPRCLRENSPYQFCCEPIDKQSPAPRRPDGSGGEIATYEFLGEPMVRPVGSCEAKRLIARKVASERAGSLVTPSVFSSRRFASDGENV
jgi:hypothetical protein